MHDAGDWKNSWAGCYGALRSTKLPHAGWMIAALCLLGTTPVNAQSVPALDLTDCRAIGSDKERLQCYDRELDAFYGIDEELTEKRAEYRRQRFGLPTDDSGLQITELEAQVVEIDSDMRSGITIVALDNGQQWQLTSSGGLRARFKPGMAVVISESGTGGYRIRIPGKTGYKGVVRTR